MTPIAESGANGEAAETQAVDVRLGQARRFHETRQRLRDEPVRAADRVADIGDRDRRDQHDILIVAGAEFNTSLV